MKPAKMRRGFTLVELLTVVVIIGVLVALLVPAVNAAREVARQGQCMNRLHELGIAVQSYLSSKGRYPGYVSPRGTSWVIELFPLIGRNDLWEGAAADPGWRNYDANAATPDPGVVMFVEALVCPDDHRGSPPDGPLSYVANPNLFRDHTVADPVHIAPSDVSVLARTVLIGERYGRQNAAGELITRDEQRKWNITAPVDVDEAAMALTFGTDDADPMLSTWGDATTVGNCLHSAHPGLVLVVFCDGHGEKLRTDALTESYPAGP